MSKTATAGNVAAGAAGLIAGGAAGLGAIALDLGSSALQPIDPLYESYKSKKDGKIKWRRRPLPPGLSIAEQVALRKVRKRAHFLDEGYAKGGKSQLYTTNLSVKWHRLCVATGVMVHGRDSILEVTGTVKDVLLYYALVMRPAMACGIPYTLRHRMLLNYALAANAPSVPVIGSHLASAVKPNSRNAMLFEDWLIRKALKKQNKTTHVSSSLTATPKQESPITSAMPSRTPSKKGKDEPPAPPEVKPTTVLYAKGKGEGGDEDTEPHEAEIAETKVTTAASSKAKDHA